MAEHSDSTGFLDGLRGLAAFGVLVCHCLIWSGWGGAAPPLFPTLAPGPLSKQLVDLFMVISGFLMTFNARRREAAEPLSRPRSWLIFYIRRFLRIAPVYYCSLLAAVVLAGPFLGGYGALADRVPALRDSFDNGRSVVYSAENLALHASFLFGLFPRWSASTQLPDWSLSLEMQFYAAFPPLMLAMRRFGPLAVGLVAAALSMAAVAGLLPLYREPSLLAFKLPLFVVGMVLCRAMAARSPARRRALRALALALTLGQAQVYGRGVVWLLACVAVVGLLAAPAKGRQAAVGAWLARILSSRPCAVAAELSYGVYLAHGFFIALVGGALVKTPWYGALPPAARAGCLLAPVLAGTVAAALLLHHGVERPGIALGRRLARRMRDL